MSRARSDAPTTPLPPVTGPRVSDCSTRSQDPRRKRESRSTVGVWPVRRLNGSRPLSSAVVPLFALAVALVAVGHRAVIRIGRPRARGGYRSSPSPCGPTRPECPSPPSPLAVIVPVVAAQRIRRARAAAVRASRSSLSSSPAGRRRSRRQSRWACSRWPHPSPWRVVQDAAEIARRHLDLGHRLPLGRRPRPCPPGAAGGQLDARGASWPSRRCSPSGGGSRATSTTSWDMGWPP